MIWDNDYSKEKVIELFNDYCAALTEYGYAIENYFEAMQEFINICFSQSYLVLPLVDENRLKGMMVGTITFNRYEKKKGIYFQIGYVKKEYRISFHYIDFLKDLSGDLKEKLKIDEISLDYNKDKGIQYEKRGIKLKYSVGIIEDDTSNASNIIDISVNR
jgi:hypothetical protein